MFLILDCITSTLIYGMYIEQEKYNTSPAMHVSYQYLPKMRQHDLATGVLVTIVRLTNHILVQIWKEKRDKHLFFFSRMSVKATMIYLMELS